MDEEEKNSNDSLELVDIIKGIYQIEDDIVDVTSLKYVLYARKSTESQERQVKSLQDQISDCIEYAKMLNLNIVDIITESESAKEPDIRPKFREMLNNLKKGKYDAVIAWHPDRLARNMKDAGELIDLLDKKIIKDLKFKSFSYTNDVSGKMLLGFAFVISKQYSDQLSVNVQRGISKRIEEGKTLRDPKYGYIKDKNNYQRPDSEYFQIMKKAFLLRLDGKTYEYIIDYLNGNNFKKANGVNSQYNEVVFTKQKLSDIFMDPFYAGVHKYGKTVVDLTKVYNFIPMISPEEFMKINQINDIGEFIRKRKRSAARNTVKFLNGKVICSNCGSFMTPTRPYKMVIKDGIAERQYRLYFKCNNMDCKIPGQKKGGTRGYIVRDFAVKFLREYQFTTEKAYEGYVLEMKKVIDIKAKEFVKEKYSLNAKLSNIDKRIEEIKEFMFKFKDTEDKQVMENFREDLRVKLNQKKLYTLQLEEVVLKIENNKGLIETYQKFVELFLKIPDLIAYSDNLEEINFYIGKIFLNLTVNKTKVLSYTLESPFKEMLEKGYVVLNRDDRT